MKFNYTRYKEMLNNIIDHIERGDKKFTSLYDLEGHYCNDGVMYNNYACDYAYRMPKHYSPYMCFYCPLKFTGNRYCHRIREDIDWAYRRNKKDLCISLIKKLRDEVYVRQGVLYK